jgi:hypothetical protein
MSGRNDSLFLGENCDYGIRCLCDYLPNEPKYEEQNFNALEQLECKLTDTYPYNLLARFYQVIMRKNQR